MPTTRGKLKACDERQTTVNYAYMREELESTELAANLFSKGVLTQYDMKYIQETHGRLEQNTVLLNMILDSGPGNSYNVFLEVLERRYPHVVKRLKQYDSEDNTSKLEKEILNNEFQMQPKPDTSVSQQGINTNIDDTHNEGPKDAEAKDIGGHKPGISTTITGTSLLTMFASKISTDGMTVGTSPRKDNRLPARQNNSKKKVPHGPEYDFSKEEILPSLQGLPGWNSDIDEKGVQKALTKLHHEDGHFLLFFCKRIKRPAISVTYRGDIKTYIIHKKPPNKDRIDTLYFIDHDGKHDTGLRELVKYHLTEGIVHRSTGDTITFKYPVLL